MKLLAVFLLFLCLVGQSMAVQPNSLFSDNAVLQQGKPLPIWGTGTDGETIEVNLSSQTGKTIVKDGHWRVTLEPLPAGGPFTMTIKGETTITCNNILIGEVWICSGQSNMERQLGPRGGQKPLENADQEIASANFPQVRMFFVPQHPASVPEEESKGKWVVCSPETASAFSAVGYFFATTLHQHLKTPVGMLFSSVGGTEIQAWTSHEALAGSPVGQISLSKYDKNVADYPAKLAAYQAQEPELLKKYEADLAKATADGKKPPSKPAPPRDPSKSNPSRLYNGMVAPLIPYALKGVIWYQGESNGGEGMGYRSLLPLMINDWRTRWESPELPFCFVQLASYRNSNPLLREAQLLTAQKVPGTAMTVTTDVGDAEDIHPTRKRPVGERLALNARAIAYGEPIEYSGPLYESSRVEGNKIIVHFSHASGLKALGDALTGFVVAGVDQKFTPAQATLQGEEVVVQSPEVPSPVAARYSWAGVTEGNLYNAADLPASPFRTDVEPTPAIPTP